MAETEEATEAPEYLRLCYGVERNIRDDLNEPRREYLASVAIDPTLPKRGDCSLVRMVGHAETRIRLREWDQQVLLHEALHALVGEVIPSTGDPDDVNHRIVNIVEVGLTLAGWRFTPAPSRPPLPPRPQS